MLHVNELKVKQDIGETFVEDVSLCDAVIKYFEDYEGQKRVTGSSKSNSEHSKDLKSFTEIEVKGRNCVDMSISVDDVYNVSDLEMFKPLFDNIKHQLRVYEEKINLCSWPVFFLENFNVQKYIPPYGVYSSLHYEHGFDRELYFRRIYVWCIYLNTVEEGGETFFPKQKIKVKAEKGKLVFFPAFFTHPHKGLKASQTKYIVTGWLSALLTGETPEELLHAHKNLNLLNRPKSYFENSCGVTIF